MCSGHGVEVERPSDDREWPEEKNDDTSWLTIILRRWTYCYMNRVLQKGSRQMLADGTHLSDDDLYKAPHTMEAAYLLSKFRKSFEEERNRKHPFLRTLWDLAAPTFVPAGFCQLITVFAQVAIPVLVQQLLAILEEHPAENVIKEGMPYAILIFAASVVNAFGNHRHKHLAMKTGVVLRAGLVSVIYDNALHLTPPGRSGLTSGEITTLVAVDTQKLFEVTQEGHLIWSCPLSMILVTILLLVIMGPTTIVGMACLVLFVPLVQFIAARMLAIRRKRVEMTDKRVEMVNAMLQGIKVTKLNNYEGKYKKRIEEVRTREVKLLQKELFYWALTLVVTVLSPVIASSATFVTYVLVSDDNVLTASMTFTVLLLFAALRFPINYTGRLIGRAAQAMDAARRIANFLDRATRCDSASEVNGKEAEAGDDAAEGRATVTLKVEGATFSVGTDSTAVTDDDDADTESSCRSIRTYSRRGKSGFSVRNVNISLPPGKILAVVGPVASGKSTLINGIIGEAQASPDSVISKRGNVAYVAQIPFILNATLRYNITFGLPYEKDRFDAVIEACCLQEDIDQLGDAGDLVEIGERGITLSGGQKQRVSLARAVYAQPSILLCDDPLSALDANTGKKIFDQLFDSKKNTLLSSSAIVLVTHAAHFLNRVDEILVVVNGSISFAGTWNQLLEYKSDDVKHMAAIEFIRSSVQESGDHDVEGEGESKPKVNADKAPQGSRSEAVHKNEEKPTDGKLMTVETREHGHSSLKTWLLWFRYAGGIPFLVIQVSLMAFDRLSYVGTEVWLSLWTQGADQPVYTLGREFPPQTEGRSAQYQYLRVFAIILLASFTSTFLRSQWAVTGGTRCARTIFDGMLASVLRAPVSYFESVPLGRVLSRFTYDTEYVDINLSQAMSTLMISVSWWVAGITIMVILLPWMALALLVTTIIYGILMAYYRKSGPDLQRLDAVSRSPIQAMLAEGLDGASTIRVFQREQVFLKNFQRATDTNSSAMLNYVTAQRYLALRIELLGSMIVLVSSSLVVALNETLQLEAGFAALLLIWSSNYTITLQFFVDTFNEAEAAITSIERVHAMSDLPKEKSMRTDESVKLPDSWPQHGLVEFHDVKLRYRDGLPLALDGLFFRASPGERIGIVGRSGAGKSSITVALFRLVEIVGGTISVDGIDLSTLGLSDVRGRLRIIPQDPFLLSGTLRDCLDPFGGSSDVEILEALKAVRLVSEVADSSALESQVEEGGSNYSVGERQLLCLARALLAKPRVLVLDEATSNVDYETDSFIQKMLRTRFNDTTLLTIAHRLNTIMDYDKILVMDNGRACECGSPKELLEKQGMFADLVASTGEESAKTLREIAFTK